MWGLLLVALGLAGFIDYHRGVKLLAAARYGPITCRLPAGWLNATPVNADDRLVACVVEPGNNPDESRQLRIYCDEARTGESVKEYLQLSELPVAIGHFEEFDTGENAEIGSTPALRLRQLAEVRTPDGQTQEVYPLTVLCAVLPNRLAVTVALEHASGASSDADTSLIDAVARSINEVQVQK